MTAPAAARPRRHWLRVTLALLTVAVVAVGAAVVYVVRSTPQYRTAFLLDTSDPGSPAEGRDFGALADAVGAAVRNSGDHDALSLRRFGGACGEPDNTRELVGSGTGNAQRISAAAHALTPGGRATLNSGLLAAIDDFSGRFPLRGSKRNRIVVVTTQGTDGCGGDPAAMNKGVRDRMDALGLQLEFRFVGYRVPAAEQEVLTRLASAVEAAAPQFTQDSAELNAVLEKLVVPSLPEAKPVEVPSQEVSVTACARYGPTPDPAPAPPPPSVRLPSQVRLPTGAQVYGADPDTYLIMQAGKACAVRTYDFTPGRQVAVSDDPEIMEGFGLGLTEYELTGAVSDCSDFGRSAPELLRYLAPGITESACKEQDTGGTVNIPTGVPGLYVGTIRESGFPEVKGMLHVLSFSDEKPVKSGLVCLLPKGQADVCTASLVYFFLQQTTGKNISDADRDRVVSAIEAYVKSLP
ncbi:hypothetical protein [Streptomyces sp. KS 21]|uniref:hypothetical protein n=1 Tax=Streptomyces sp. KS 21 TaxID=2485150 RepID=UPI0010638540|nr:hypothetical protein [Streptomyces sp. KS 21]TDU77085.1 hypothetical protein EDD91_3815 [Streptomyces sp. KS 21]